MVDMPNMTNMTEAPMMEEAGDSDKRKLLQDEGMVDMPNMTNSTDMMEEAGDSDKRRLLQDLLDGVIDMPNMTNITQTVTDGVQNIVGGVQDTANDLVSSIGGRRLLLA